MLGNLSRCSGGSKLLLSHKYTVNAERYSVKESSYSRTLYDDKTKERFEITINNDFVTKNFCKMLVKRNAGLIKCIPKSLHTKALYNIVMKKNKGLFNQFSMNDELRGEYLTQLVNSDDIRMSSYSQENLQHFTIENYVTEVKRSPYYLKYVPKEKHEHVLKELPKSFFTIETLCHLFDLTMNLGLFNRYFGHIKLYRIVNQSLRPITRYYIDNSHMDDGYGISTGTGWYNLSYNNLTYHPDKFLHYVDMKNIVNIQEVQLLYEGDIKFEHCYAITTPLWHPITDSIKLDPSTDKFTRE